jgi:hypothetical protein
VHGRAAAVAGLVPDGGTTWLLAPADAGLWQEPGILREVEDGSLETQMERETRDVRRHDQRRGSLLHCQAAAQF